MLEMTTDKLNSYSLRELFAISNFHNFLRKKKKQN